MTQYSTAVAVTVSLIYAAIILAAVFGNLLVIGAVWTRKHLRNPANAILVSLAFADLLVALIAMTANAINDVAGKWVYPLSTCEFFTACDIFFCTASILHLCFISVERFRAKRLDKRTVGAVLAGLWLASALISFVPIYFGWNLENVGSDVTIIDEMDHCRHESNLIYTIVASLLAFWIPGTVTAILYLLIFLQIRSGKRSTGGATIYTAQAQTEEQSDEAARVALQINGGKSDHLTTKMVAVVVGAFFVCWLPFFILYLVMALCGPEHCYCPLYVYQMTFWISYFNSCLNPFIYAYFKSEFKKAFREILDRVFCGLCKCLKSETSE